MTRSKIMPKAALASNQPHKIHNLVEFQSRIRPTKIAIAFHGQKITYGELNAKAKSICTFFEVIIM